MRLELGHRASAVADGRMSAHGKDLQEYRDILLRYAL